MWFHILFRNGVLSLYLLCFLINSSNSHSRPNGRIPQKVLQQFPEHVQVGRPHGSRNLQADAHTKVRIESQFHSPPRLLVTITSYSFQRWDCIDELLQNYRDICEGGWDVKIYFLTAANVSPRLASWISRNLQCSRLGDSDKSFSIPFVVLKINNRSIENRIVDYSRLPISLELDHFDVFFYGEDDIVFTLSHLNNWVKETKILHSLTDKRVIKDVQRCGLKFPCKFTIGFLRYWRKNAYSRDEISALATKYRENLIYNQEKGDRRVTDTSENSKEYSYTTTNIEDLKTSTIAGLEHLSSDKTTGATELEQMEATLGHGNKQMRSGGQLWFESAIYDKNRLEEIPTFDKICIAGYPYVSLRSSPHQASWILLKSDILELNKTCGFIGQTWDKTWKNQGFVREYMSSYSIYSNPFHTRPPVNCMLNKVLPAGKMEIFKIRHYQRSKVSKSNAPAIYTSEEGVMQLEGLKNFDGIKRGSLAMDKETRDSVSSKMTEKDKLKTEPSTGCWTN